MEKKAHNLKPWEFEPDYEFGTIDNHVYVVNRNFSGNLCGYLGIHHSELHELPLDYANEALWHIQVHGGLTYSGNAHNTIIDNYHFYGFDCGHADDLVPRYLSDPKLCALTEHATYRNFKYVKEQICKMHMQFSGTPINNEFTGLLAEKLAETKLKTLHTCKKTKVTDREYIMEPFTPDPNDLPH